MSFETLPFELYTRVLDALTCHARASACCVCRAWSVEAAAGWQARAIDALAGEVVGLGLAAQEFAEAGTLRDERYIDGLSSAALEQAVDPVR